MLDPFFEALDAVIHPNGMTEWLAEPPPDRSKKLSLERLQQRSNARHGHGSERTRESFGLADDDRD
jgi:hypothetical protein